MIENDTEAFVYLWQDARQKPYMYYIGYHKGHPDDAYTHSSKKFESFTKNNIPHKVTRKILATGTSEDMMNFETKLLQNRKERKWDKYYNQHANAAFPPYLWEDPEYRAMMSEKATKQWEDPEFRAMQSEKRSEQNKKQWKDPEFRAMHSKKMSEQNKKQRKDPEFRAMHSKKMSEQTKKQWEDPEHRAKVNMKVSCNFCGFVGTKRNIVRWHNDNCKHKKRNTLEGFFG